MRRRGRSLWLTAPSRFAALGREQAWGVLALIALLLLASGVVAPAPPASREAAQAATDPGDIAAGDGIVERVRHGETYYPVAADTLRQGGYPLRPFHTFPLPTLAVALSALPEAARPVPLYLLSLAVLVAWAVRLGPAFTRRAPLILALLLLVAGSLSGWQAALVSFHDLWAGLFIALSLGRWRRGRWVEAVALGLCAALVRELAAPYLLLMATAAWSEGERREAAAWLTALAIFAAVLATHAHAVSAVLRASDPVSPGWTGMLGPGFAIGAVATSTALHAAPLWLAAPLIALSAVGWTAWRDPLGGRVIATLAAHALLLAIGAQADNLHWALLVAPVSLLGLAFVPDAARDLLRAALDRQRITVTRVVR